MCGRYALTLPPEAVRAFFGYAEQPNFPPRYNIAPTQPVPVVTLDNGARRFTLMRWGFIPGWVKDLKAWPLVINVRSETAREKPAFRAAMTRRRCLMPADGLYEWRRVGKESEPYLFRRPDHGPFAFAALHETWHSPDGSEIDTVALVNSHANGLMAAVHHRCPIILDPRDHDLWLDPGAEPRQIDAMLKPPPDEMLEMVRIGKTVNKVANDGPEVQAPFEAASEPLAPAPPPAPAPDDAGLGPARQEDAATPPAAKRRRAGSERQGSLF